MNQQVDRSAKLKTKLRASETARVRVQRELDFARSELVKANAAIRQLEKEIKRLKKEATP